MSQFSNSAEERAVFPSADRKVPPPPRRLDIIEEETYSPQRLGFMKEMPMESYNYYPGVGYRLPSQMPK